MAEHPVTIAVAMACFNRRETTLRCLRALMQQQTDSVRLSVHLLDDASRDGTADAVRNEFPETTIIQGDGNRYWGGGMHLAIHSAIEAGFDYLLWLNDDVVLKPDAITRLLAAQAQADTVHSGPNVIVGPMENPADGELSYGGFQRLSWWHPARVRRIGPKLDGLTPCDTLNGNAVLMSRAVVDRLGPIDDVFVHQLGDIDYGYRVTRAGGKNWLASSYVGFCAPNENPPIWHAAKSFRDLLRLLATPRGLPIRPWSTFMWRHGGPAGLVALVGIYALQLAPRTKPSRL